MLRRWLKQIADDCNLERLGNLPSDDSHSGKLLVTTPSTQLTKVSFNKWREWDQARPPAKGRHMGLGPWFMRREDI